jgi:tRNA (mo5U34)-methyltransferase
MAALELPEDVDPALLRELTMSREWFHRIDLGHGVVTPGIDDTADKLRRVGLPRSLAGKTLLDIGAYDGFFSFEAERRHAERVVAADHFCWSQPDGSMADGRGFDIAHWALHSQVEKRWVAVEDISPETVGEFDYVLFLGVLYHAPDPLGYLAHAYSVCRDTLILETHVDAMDQARPTMVFYPGDTLGGDPSNHWGPNRQCVVDMLREVGFRSVEEVSFEGTRMTFHAHR